MSRRAEDVAALFSPQKLQQARQMQGMSRAQLAREARLSAASISQYESGTSRPRPKNVAELALKLEVPIEFLAERRGSPRVPVADEAFFRSLRRTSKRDRERAVGYAGLVAQLVAEIERHASLPQFEPIDDLTLDPDDPPEAAEEAARAVRERWGLGTGPIQHLVRLLERRGIIVVRLSLNQDVDAFSWAAGDRPLILLGNEKRDFERSRFDAAHEFGHIVMHASDPEAANAKMEQQAHRFANSLLIPAEMLQAQWPKGRINWSDLVAIKHEWGISIAALLMRALQLGLISTSEHESKMKYMSRMGWRRREPGAHRGVEQPELLNHALGLLQQNGISLQRLTEEGNLTSVNSLRQRLELTPKTPLNIRPA